MIIGLLTLQLHIPASESLKDKRMVVKSLIERIRNRFNVSISEIDAHDLWQRSVIAIAMVANQTLIIQKVFEKIRNIFIQETSIEVLNCDIEFL